MVLIDGLIKKCSLVEGLSLMVFDMAGTSDRKGYNRRAVLQGMGDSEAENKRPL